MKSSNGIRNDRNLLHEIAPAVAQGSQDQPAQKEHVILKESFGSASAKPGGRSRRLKLARRSLKDEGGDLQH
jgi:hypothetical protein